MVITILAVLNIYKILYEIQEQKLVLQYMHLKREKICKKRKDQGEAVNASSLAHLSFHLQGQSLADAGHLNGHKTQLALRETHITRSWIKLV